MTEPRTEVYVEFGDYNREPLVPTEEHPANAYFSQDTEHDDIHWPCIDLDLPARLVPSSTKGHFHLYIDRPVMWDAYVKLLDALVNADLVEVGYRDAAVAQGGTTVRMPHIKKGVEPF